MDHALPVPQLSCECHEERALYRSDLSKIIKSLHLQFFNVRHQLYNDKGLLSEIKHDAFVCLLATVRETADGIFMKVLTEKYL